MMIELKQFSDLFGVCIMDHQHERILGGYSEISEDMTIEKCLFICRSNGFPYSGLEWQVECHCGFEPRNGFRWSWPSKCEDRCAGDSNQICGGSEAMSVWTTPDKYLQGLCVIDRPGIKRVLKGKAHTGLKTLTIQQCHDICKGKMCFFDKVIQVRKYLT